MFSCTFRPSNGCTIWKVRARNLRTKGKVDKAYRSGDAIAEPNFEKRNVQYLYGDMSGYHFMDLESYDQFTMDEDILGDALLYLRPNSSIVALFYEGNVDTIELPSSVVLTVTDTTPQVKGATVTNQLKEATMETGLQTRVPPFIEIGEELKISTSDGSYMDRAKE